MIGSLEKSVKNAFLGSFEDNCLEMVVGGYLALCENGYDREWHETDFSSELVRLMEELPIANHYKIRVGSERPINLPIKNKGDAKKLPRIDIKMLRWVTEKKEFTIEAKNLCETNWHKEGVKTAVNAKSLQKEYVSEGIKRYVSEKYPFGCMIGYVQQGNIDTIITGINDFCDGTTIGFIQNKETIFDYEYFYSSSNQIEEKPRKMRHIFLDLTNGSTEL